MRIRDLVSSFFGRRQSRTPIQRVRNAHLRLECLEDRTVPTVLTFLDTFSGASFSDGAVNSGGTAAVDSALNPSLGVVVNNHVSNPRPSDSGIDIGLRSGPVDDGAPDAGQLADTRTLGLAATNPPVGGSTHADVDSGQLFFSSDAQNSATMTLTYDNLSAVDLEVLTAGAVTVDFLSNDVQFNVGLKVNTGAGAGTDTFFAAQPVLASGAPQAITFDASALVGKKLNTMVFTFAGSIDTDFTLADIKATTGIPAIHIVKYVNGDDANAPTGPHVALPGNVTFTYVVTNTGDVPLANVTVTDDKLGLIAGPASGDTNTNSLLDLTETWTYTTIVPAVAGQQTNIGTVTGNAGNPNGAQVTDDDPANYFGDTPQIQIIKYANDLDSECGHVPVGSTVNFRYDVTNPGNVPIANVVVTDPDVSNLSGPTKTGGNQDDLLDPGETWTYTASTTAVVGEHHNTGTVNGNDSFIATATVTDNDDACYIGENPPPADIRMTGGGSIFLPTGAVPGAGLRVTHGFELHCTDLAPGDPNSVGNVNNHLEINWDSGANHIHFHLSYLNTIDCVDDPNIDPPPPPFTAGGADTLIGVGTGQFSGKFGGTVYKKAAATVYFVFKDAGEPGVNDTASYKIVLTGSNLVVLNTDSNDADTDPDLIKLTKGNHQVHPELQNLTAAAGTLQSQIDQTFTGLDTANTATQVNNLTAQLLSQFAAFEATQAGANITGLAFRDTNKDGSRQLDEVGLAGITVKLYNSAGTLIAATTTDVNGFYSFSAAPGTYTVRFTKPSSTWTFSPKYKGSSIVDSDVNANGISDLFTLASGQTRLYLNAGMY